MQNLTFILLFSFLILNINCKKPTEEIIKAFDRDQYKVQKVLEYEGMRGFVADSLISTTLR
jgi:hypothetical protein